MEQFSGKLVLARRPGDESQRELMTRKDSDCEGFEIEAMKVKADFER